MRSTDGPLLILIGLAFFATVMPYSEWYVAVTTEIARALGVPQASVGIATVLIAMLAVVVGMSLSRPRR